MEMNENMIYSFHFWSPYNRKQIENPRNTEVKVTEYEYEGIGGESKTGTKICLDTILA
jgi:hypothetical protein